MIPAVAVLTVLTACGLWLLFARKRGEPKHTHWQRIIRWRYRAARKALALAHALDIGYTQWRMTMDLPAATPKNEEQFPPPKVEERKPEAR